MCQAPYLYQLFQHVHCTLWHKQQLEVQLVCHTRMQRSSGMFHLQLMKIWAKPKDSLSSKHWEYQTFTEEKKKWNHQSKSTNILCATHKIQSQVEEGC